MSLRFSSSQLFPVESGLVLIPLNSNWNLNFGANVSTPKYDFMKNSPSSGAFHYQLKPKSSYSIYVNQGYSNLKVRGEIIYQENDPQWLTVQSDWFPVANYTAENQSTFKNISFFVSPPLSISQGIHVAMVKFHIEGLKNGNIEVLSVYEVPVELRVFEEGYFYSPSEFTFFYNPENPSLNQLLTIGGNNWTVNVPTGLVLTGPGVVTAQNLSSHVSGTGLEEFQLTLNHNNISSVMSGVEEIILPVTVSYAAINYTIPVKVIQTGEVYPLNTGFIVQSGIVDYYFRIIHINREGNFTVNSAASVGHEILDTSEGRKLKIFLIDPTMFGAGFYFVFVNINFDDESYSVLVNINVGNSIDVGIEGVDAVFTHSMDDLSFTSSNVGSYVDLMLTVVGFENALRYQFPYFKGLASKNIGKILSNFINYQSTSITSTYPFNYFNLKVNEMKNNVMLTNYTKNNVPFVRGYKPLIINNKAILHHNTTSRYTADSFALVSIYALNGVFEYKLLKNDIEVFSSNQIFGYLSTVKISFNDFNAVEGDVFDFVLITGTDDIKKSFVIFPSVENSLNVVYLDSFGLQASFNFTGNSNIITTELKNKAEQYNSKTFVHSRKFLENEQSTINLNTGFVLKSQALEVIELVKSEKAWLVKDDLKIVELVPKLEAMQESSSDNFLVSFNIEFDINKEKYAQDYNA